MWGYDSERQGKAGSSNDNYRIAGDELRPQSAALLDALSPVTPVPSEYHLPGQLAICVCAVIVLVELHCKRLCSYAGEKTCTSGQL